MVWLVATTLVGVLLVVLHVFNSFWCCTAGLLAVIAAWRYRGDGTSARSLSPSVLLMLGLMLAGGLVLRLNPSRYVLGAQDEGLYVLIAQQFRREGGNTHIDTVRQAIKNPKLRRYYDRFNQRDVGNPSRSWFEKDKYEGVHYLGLYISNLDKSQYVFQFYPAQPIWIAIFSSVFGQPNGVWDTVFFGLLSICMAFYLVLEVSGSGTAALVAAGLLTVNALHVFFSRFPVSEMAALAFFLSSLLYLARFANTGRTFALVLSGGAMLCYFFARISGFILLPYFAVLLLFSLVYCRDSRQMKQVVVYCLAVMAGFVLSVAYGYTQTYPYFRDILVRGIGHTLGDHWQLKIAYAGLAMAVLVVLTWLCARWFRPLSDWLLAHKCAVLVALIGLVSAAALYHVYLFAYTNTYTSPTASSDWRWAGKGLRSVHYSTVYVFGLMVTFPGILLLIRGLWRAVRRNTLADASILFLLLLFWTYISLAMKVAPYLYYYGRYQVSELIPLALIAIGLGFVPVFQSRPAP